MSNNDVQFERHYEGNWYPYGATLAEMRFFEFEFAIVAKAGESTLMFRDPSSGLSQFTPADFPDAPPALSGNFVFDSNGAMLWLRGRRNQLRAAAFA